MQSRVPMLAMEDSLNRGEEAGIPEPMAKLSVFRVLLQHPPVGKAIKQLLSTLLFNAKLDDRLRELIIMRIGWSTGSVYEWTQHWRVALALGVEAEDVLAVRDWRASNRFGAAERAVLAATDETLEHGEISKQTWAECEAVLKSAEERLELVAAIGCWSMISTLLRSLQVPLEDGVAAWPPDAVAPRA